jgi:hypothetical protein
VCTTGWAQRCGVHDRLGRSTVCAQLAGRIAVVCIIDWAQHCVCMTDWVQRCSAHGWLSASARIDAINKGCARLPGSGSQSEHWLPKRVLHPTASTCSQLVVVRCRPSSSFCEPSQRPINPSVLSGRPASTAAQWQVLAGEQVHSKSISATGIKCTPGEMLDQAFCQALAPPQIRGARRRRGASDAVPSTALSHRRFCQMHVSKLRSDVVNW